jgi:ABC-type lipoprotein export system ATPase subunit
VHKLDTKMRAALRNRNIGFVFQSYHLLDDQTFFRNLELPLSYRDVGKKDRQSIVCDTLDDFRSSQEGSLSQSAFRRPAVNSLALRGSRRQSRMILADEPTGNLHSSQGKEIMEMFKRLKTKAQPSFKSRTPKQC